MMKRLHLIILSTLLALTLSAERVGLVLSGGGAKGIAEIGVIQALEENDIPIDCAAGTSMGAIVAGLYACGYSPAEMMALIASEEFRNASQAIIPPRMIDLYATPEASPALYTFNAGNDAAAKQVPQSLIGPMPMNWVFVKLFAPLSARCGEDFDRLFVPFRCVASNATAKRKHVWRSGSVADAIRSSMSYPLVFCPVVIEGDTLLYDGGIYDNFPVGVMRSELHPDIMIGVDVHVPDSLADNSPTLLNQVDNLMMQESDYSLPAAEGIKLHLDLHEYSLLDFDKAEAIYAIGYRAGLEMIDSIRSRVSARRTAEETARVRARFKASIPTLRFRAADINVPSMTSLLPEGEFGAERAEKLYCRAVSSGQLQNLDPKAEQFDPADSTYVLRLKAYPKADWQVGAGGYLTTARTNMLYGSVAYRPVTSRYAAKLGLWGGQSYLGAHMTHDWQLGSRRSPWGMGMDVAAWRQLYASSLKREELSGRLTLLRLPAGLNGVVAVRAGAGTARFTSPAERTLLRELMAEADWRFDNGTTCARVTAGGYTGTHDWGQLYAQGRHRFTLSEKVTLTAQATAFGATRVGTLLEAPEYLPSPTAAGRFNAGFRAWRYGALAVVPEWQMTQKLSLNAAVHAMAPLKPLCGRQRVRTFTELTAIMDLKLVKVNAFGSYTSGPDGGWHCGVSLGLYITAPKLY